MKNLINWQSQNEIQHNLNLPAEVARLKKHNALLDVVITSLVAVMIALVGFTGAVVIWG